MTRPGGVADKLGNEYEGLWTASALLDVLDGEFDGLVVEPISEEGDGVEYLLTGSSAHEYYSIKRRRSDGREWSPAALLNEKALNGRSVIGDLFAKLALSDSTSAVFAYGTSASRFREITDRARNAPDDQTFEKLIAGSDQLSADFHDRIQPALVFAGLVPRDALGRLRLKTADDATLRASLEQRIRARFRMRASTNIDSLLVQAVLADLILANFGRRITANEIWSALDEHDIVARAWGPGERERIESITDAFLSSVEALSINGNSIPRTVAQDVSSAILAEAKWVMIEGAAGAGKSNVLAQVARELKRQGVTCLTIRLDTVSGSVSSRRLGEAIGLPDSPALVLGEIELGRPAVLLIDQVDAISVVSGRNPSLQVAVDEILSEAQRYPRSPARFCLTNV